MLTKERLQKKVVIQDFSKAELTHSDEETLKRVSAYSEEPAVKSYINSFEVQMGKKILQKCLEKKGSPITFTQLAKEVGTDRLTIEHFVRGRYIKDTSPNDPMKMNMDLLEKIKAVLGISD
ncbi:hypothetical protein [Priestia aryabhattai]